MDFLISNLFIRTIYKALDNFRFLEVYFYKKVIDGIEDLNIHHQLEV